MIKRSLKGFDWSLLGLIVFLGGIGLLTLYSISTTLFYKQLIWYGLAFSVIFIGSQINWQWFLTQSWFRHGFYWLSVVLVTIPIIQNTPIRGVRSWILLGDFQFEPSELMKIALIIFLAGFFSRKYLAAWQAKNIFYSLFYAAVPATIITIQPDLGSALVIAGIWVGFLLMSGVNKKRFFIGFGVAVLVFILLWVFVLQPYQKQRITALFYPDIDPLGINYNVTQSKIAIGSAGFWGKGFNSGTQTQLGFLPESHTDFIFASFVEEWGVFGGILLILTYLALILKIAFTGLKVRRNDLKFVVLGAALVFLVHFFVNVGSNVGVVPVIGINLPFVSYGGSNLLTASVLVSIIERVKIESAY